MAQSWKTKYENETVYHEVTKQQLKVMTDWKDECLAQSEVDMHRILYLEAELQKETDKANGYARFIADTMEQWGRKGA